MKTRSCFFLFLFVGFVLTSCQPDPPLENKPPVVQAGQDTTFAYRDAKSTIELTGTATDADGSVVAYLWSQVSGLTTASIADAGSPATTVSNMVPGAYVFQLMATDNKGATGVDAVTININSPQEVTITLQAQEDVTDLHFILNHLGASNDPTVGEIGASAWTFDGDPAFQRGLLKFNLAKLPAGAEIQSATLSLYSNPNPKNGDLVHANYGTNNTMLIQRVTSNWNMTTDWDDQPTTTTEGQIIIPHTDASFLDLPSINVTEPIRNMLQTANYGFLIRLQNETYYNSRIFCSSKFTDASKRPKLVITYRG
jgi:hypothetical protein